MTHHGTFHCIGSADSPVNLQREWLTLYLSKVNRHAATTWCGWITGVGTIQCQDMDTPASSKCLEMYPMELDWRIRGVGDAPRNPSSPFSMRHGTIWAGGCVGQELVGMGPCGRIPSELPHSPDITVDTRVPMHSYIEARETPGHIYLVIQAVPYIVRRSFTKRVWPNRSFFCEKVCERLRLAPSNSRPLRNQLGSFSPQPQGTYDISPSVVACSGESHLPAPTD